MEGTDQTIVPSDPAPNEPAPQAPEAAPDGTPSFDPKAFEDSLKIFGPDWNLSNYQEKLRETRKQIHEKGMELSRLKTQYGEVEPLIKAKNEDPGLAKALHDAVAGYYDQQQAGPYANPALQTFDPVAQHLRQQDIELRTMKIERDLDRLESAGFELDPEKREVILTKMLETPGIGTAKDYYMMTYGDELIAKAARNATQATAEAIKKNNNAYKPTSTRTAAPAPSKGGYRAGMSEAEFSEVAARRAAELLNFGTED